MLLRCHKRYCSLGAGETSPGKIHCFHPIWPETFTSMDSVQCWISSCFADSSIHGCLIHHKPVALPTASFRFHLAMDTLAVQLEISTATLSRVFHPLAMNHASHTKDSSHGHHSTYPSLMNCSTSACISGVTSLGVPLYFKSDISIVNSSSVPLVMSVFVVMTALNSTKQSS